LQRRGYMEMRSTQAESASQQLAAKQIGGSEAAAVATLRSIGEAECTGRVGAYSRARMPCVACTTNHLPPTFCFAPGIPLQVSCPSQQACVPAARHLASSEPLLHSRHGALVAPKDWRLGSTVPWLCHGLRGKTLGPPTKPRARGAGARRLELREWRHPECALNCGSAGARSR
jgi:hypothetical protein